MARPRKPDFEEDEFEDFDPDEFIDEMESDDGYVLEDEDDLEELDFED